VELPLSPLL
jgi:hypothetical protein